MTGSRRVHHDPAASPFREVTVTLRAYEWVNILNRLEPHDPSTRRLHDAYDQQKA